MMVQLYRFAKGIYNDSAVVTIPQMLFQIGA
jgi:hypothetical protein